MSKIPNVNFPGIRQPSIDFGEVRDGRRSQLLWFDVDLSTARSVLAGTHTVINIAGNSFYIDNDAETVGYARVHFQDTNLDVAPAPVFVGPGFIASVPFTQILIENSAQVGMCLRIFYGIDIDFKPSLNAQVSINGAVAIIDAPSSNCQVYVGQDTLTPATSNTRTLLAAASNVSGIVLREISLFINNLNTSTSGGATVYASPSSGFTFGGNSGQANTIILCKATAGPVKDVSLEFPAMNRLLPAGWGIFSYASNGAGTGNLSALSTVSFEILP